MDDIMVLFLLEPDKFLLGRVLGENETDVYDSIECNRQTYIDKIRSFMIAHPPKRLRLIGEIALCQVVVNEITIVFDNLDIEVQAFVYAPENIKELNELDMIKERLPKEFKNDSDVLSSIETSFAREKKTEGGLYLS